MNDRTWAPRAAEEPGYRHLPPAVFGSHVASPALQRAIAAGRMPLSPMELGQLQRTAGNRAVQRLVGAGVTVQRQPTPPTSGATEQKTVKGAGPVGGAGGALPPGSKVTVAPPPPTPAHGAGEGKEEEKAVEFHAEVSGKATVEKVSAKPAEGKGGAAVAVGVELPKATLLETGKEGGPKFKFLTNPELHVKLGGAIDTAGKVSGDLRTEVGIDLARVVAGPWSYRLAAAGGELSTSEGLAGKVGVGAEKELPKAGGLGLKSEVAVGLSGHGPGGEATVKLLYGLKAGASAQVYFFGEAKGTVAKDGSDLKAEGTTFLGAGVKF